MSVCICIYVVFISELDWIGGSKEEKEGWDIASPKDRNYWGMLAEILI